VYTSMFGNAGGVCGSGLAFAQLQASNLILATFCQRRDDQVAKLIAGPKCSFVECLRGACDQVKNAGRAPLVVSLTLLRKVRKPCSFCPQAEDFGPAGADVIGSKHLGACLSRLPDRSSLTALRNKDNEWHPS